MMGFLFDVGVTNAVLTALLAVVVVLVTRTWKNPHLAHLLWLIVLLKMVTPPLLNVSIPFRFEWNGSEVEPSPMRGFEAAAHVQSSEYTDGSQEHIDVSASIQRKSLTLAETQTPSAMVTTISEGRRPSWPIYLGVTWLAGSLVCALLAGIRIGQFHHNLKETCLAGETLRRIGRAVAHELGLKLCPELRITNSRLGPMVWPIGRPPIVVLPSGLIEELEEDQLRTIVAHEYAHVARRDCLVRWLEVLCTVLYWWHPCLWLARREIRQAEELCCDALVMRAYSGHTHQFGEALLKVDEFLSNAAYRSPILASEMRGAGQMKTRIEMIVNEQLPPRLGRTTKLSFVIAALAILPLSAQESQPSNSESSAKSGRADVADSVSTGIVRPKATQPTQELRVEQILEGWKAYEDSMSTATFECSLLKVMSPLFASPTPFVAVDDEEEESPIPETLKSEILFSMSRNKIACTKHSEYRARGTSPLKTRERRIGFDGHETRVLNVKDDDAPLSLGSIRTGSVPSAVIALDPELRPLFLACRPYSFVPNWGYSPRDAQILDVEADYDGIKAVKILLPTNGVVTITSGAGTFTLTALKSLFARASDPRYADKTHTYGMSVDELKDLLDVASDPKRKEDTRRAIIYASRDNGHRILGVVEERKGVKFNEVSLRYVSDEKFGWRLSGWKSNSVDPSGAPLLSIAGKVVDAELGQPIHDKEFRPIFPVGTHLKVDNEYYMQQPGDVLRLLRVGEYGRVPGT